MDISYTITSPSNEVKRTDKFDAFKVTLVEALPVIVFELRSKSPDPVSTTLVRSTPVIGGSFKI